MILKTLDYRKSELSSDIYEEWNYFDNIEAASTYFDEGAKMTVVRCSFKDGNSVTFAVPNVAYLMGDNGKTIEKIIAANVEELGDEEPVYNTLHDAAVAAMAD